MTKGWVPLGIDMCTYLYYFNSRGGQNNDSRGELIENFITKNDICIMNDKSYTYHSPSTKSFTSIDLSFCRPSLFLDSSGVVKTMIPEVNLSKISLQRMTFVL